MFGVPGDFNLGFLVSHIWFSFDYKFSHSQQDLIEDHSAIDWVGNW